MEQFHRSVYIINAKPTGKEIGPLYALYECPVEYRSCTCAGIKEDILSGAAVYSLYVACRLDSKSFDDCPVGKLAQIMDICLIFASVELAYVNCAAVQQTDNVFRIFIYKHAHSFYVRVKQSL